MPRPSYRHETELMREHGATRVCGIDEVGRGPWAGPVVAVAVMLDVALLPKKLARRLDDSKALTREAREDIDASLRALFGAAVWAGFGEASVAEIDEINILQASFLAMRRAHDALPVAPEAALVDGNKYPALPCPGRAVIGGDALCFSIAAASILAKVARDRTMRELAETHPGYGWHTNVGYGTAEHQSGLARLGVTPHHRRSFAPVAKLLATIS
ncbi:MAG TPA: ribonuclease HII [Alphaproteobacteria bacterium]|jgi:ribonuclease HII